MSEESIVCIEIFDPPMCCPTGVCGPSIDPALLDIQESLIRVAQEFDDKARVERYLLSQQAARFMQHPAVMALLKKEGVSVLPVTVVNGEIQKTKAYPTFQELKQWIGSGRNNHGQR